MSIKPVKIKRVWLITGAIALLFLGGVFVLNKIIEHKVEQNLQLLVEEGKVGFSSIQSNFLTSSITIYNLTIKEKPETSAPIDKFSIYLSKTSLKGIKFIHLLLKKELLISELDISNIELKTDTSLFRQLVANQFFHIRLPYKALSVNNLVIRELDIKLLLPRRVQTILKGQITFHNIRLNTANNKVSYDNFCPESFEGKVSEMNFPLERINSWLYIRNLELDSRRATLHLDSLFIRPEDEKEINIVPAVKFTMYLSEIEFIKPDLAGLFHNRLKSEKILIHNSNITITDKLKIPPKNSQGFPYPPMDLTNWALSIHSLDLAKISLGYSGQEQQFNANGNLTFFGIKNNVPGNPLRKGVFEFSSLGGSLSDIRYNNSSSDYGLTIGKVLIDYKNKVTTIHSLSMTPHFGKFDLSKKLGYQADWIKAVLPKVAIKNIDFQGLLKNQLRADEISVEGAAVHLFRDRRYPENTHRKLLPVEYLKKLSSRINVHILHGINCSINYEEFPKDGTKAENVGIENLRFSLTPFTNYESKPAGMHLKAEALLMRSGEIYSSLYMPLQSDNYYMKGAIKNFELTALNPASENLGKFRIKSGFLDSLGFEMNFNAERATGKITGIYHNMIIQQLKVKNGVKQPAKLRSFLLRHLIIPLNKDKSLPEGRRTGKINYAYDPRRNVSYYLLHSLLSGIKDSFTFGFLLPK